MNQNSNRHLQPHKSMRFHLLEPNSDLMGCQDCGWLRVHPQKRSMYRYQANDILFEQSP